MDLTVRRNSGRHNAVDDDIVYPNAVPFLIVHLACLTAVWTGVGARSLMLALTLYVVRMFGITAGLHRYFAHRSFQTGRWFQFLLAWLGQSSAQGGVLWWASKHRCHHRHSDTPEDVHSPRLFGFLFAHIGWVYAARRGKADYSNIKDLVKYPELVWLDRHIHLPIVLLLCLGYIVSGWQGVVVGVLWSTVALYHATFAINSLAHLWGSQRYYTGDDSRNNALLAAVTLGEGWHNNHHYCMSSARQGFFWWEIDPTYWALRVLGVLRIVWEIRVPTDSVRRGERRLTQTQVIQAACELARRVELDGSIRGDRLALERLARTLVGSSLSLPEVVSLTIEQAGI